MVITGSPRLYLETLDYLREIPLLPSPLLHLVGAVAPTAPDGVILNFLTLWRLVRNKK